MSSAEVETHPDLEDIKPLKTSSRGLVISGLITFASMFIGIGAWAYFAAIQGAVIATGSVAVIGKPKTIQHLDGGLVSDIYVENGDVVKAGDILLSLDDTILNSNLDIYKNRFREAVSRRDRLKAEQENRSSILWDETPFEKIGFSMEQEFRDGQNRIFQARRATTRGQVSQLNERISQLNNQIDGIEALSKSKNTQISILTGEYDNIAGLAKDGYASESRVLALERQIEELSGQQYEHQAEVARVRNTISEVRVQIAQITKEFDQVVLTELQEVELGIKDMEQQILATQEQLSRVDITAPISGVVHEQAIFTIGGVIGPGAPVLQIIPEGQNMEFEVNVEPQNIDQIFEGQEVSVMFSAFNMRTTPQLNGTVKSVSLNTSVDEASGFAFYPVRISFPEEELARLDGKALVSGMPIEAFFTTDSRSPMNYLIKPLTDNVKRALREE